MAELARKNDATLLFASTSEVYGDTEIIPTPETYWGKVNPIGPRSCYDEGKRFAEALLMAYAKQYGLDVRVPRIFNSYGPRLREDGLYGRAMSRFILQALTNQPITVYGDGKQTRSFCYITDTVTGLMLSGNKPKRKRRSRKHWQHKRNHHNRACQKSQRNNQMQISHRVSSAAKR